MFCNFLSNNSDFVFLKIASLYLNLELHFGKLRHAWDATKDARAAFSWAYMASAGFFFSFHLNVKTLCEQACMPDQ